MVSAQVAGTVIFQARSPEGKVVELFRSIISNTAPTGGASEGALSAIVTPEKRIWCPTRNDVQLRFNDVIEHVFIPVAGSAVVVSKSLQIIPLTRQDGTVMYIQNGDFTVPAYANVTTVTALPTTLAGYRVTQNLKFGGGPIFSDVQNGA